VKTTTNLRQLNCAIYTRKSTEEGLEQEFNTLDAQRESAECYIKSQEAEGWVCLPEHYDDGGYTGGNMERPALKRIVLADGKLVNCHVERHPFENHCRLVLSVNQDDDRGRIHW